MKITKKNFYHIWLSSINTISLNQKIDLIHKYKTPQKVFYNINIEEYTSKGYLEKLGNKIQAMRKQNIKIITYQDKEYPIEFKRLYDFPLVLYCKGNTKLLNEKYKISIIGCREYTEYGKNVTLKMAYELGKYGIAVVSGCARGIDSFAHIGCIKANQGTVAVLGNGIDYIYPPENKILEDRIIEQNGLLMSEYIIGTKPNKFAFPERNRLISALASGVLVVEAKQRSGTMITVEYALNQGKNVYAIPGNINSENSFGTNNLLKQGAKMVTNVEDILEDLIII